MSSELSWRRRIMANWIVLCVNVALFALLASRWVTRMGQPSSEIDEVIHRGQQILGMDVYCARSPFAVFVSRDFPRNQSFSFYQDGTQLFLTSEERTGPPAAVQEDNRHEEASATKDIMLMIGEGFSVSCSCTGANGPHVEQLTVMRDNGEVSEGYIDLNADGFPDVRFARNRKDGGCSSEIWYDGKWQEAIAQGKKYEKQLAGGGKVAFDRERGQWVQSAQEK